MYLLSNGVKIISFITDPQLIRHILEHLGVSVQKSSRDPPSQEAPHEKWRESMNPVELLRTNSWIPQGEPFKPALNLIQ